MLISLLYSNARLIRSIEAQKTQNQSPHLKGLRFLRLVLFLSYHTRLNHKIP